MTTAAGGMPTVTVKLDDGSGSFPYDISAYVHLAPGYTIQRGRTDEFDELETSVLTMTLNNTDGRFTRGSTVYNVAIDQRIQVTHKAGTLSSKRFTGYVQAWPVTWPGSGMDRQAFTVITATDRKPRLARRELRSITEEEHLRYGPAAYYPLAEPLISSAASSIARTPAPKLLPSQIGKGGLLVFGSGAGTPYDGLVSLALSYVNSTNGPGLASAQHVYLPGADFTLSAFARSTGTGKASTLVAWGATIGFLADGTLSATFGDATVTSSTGGFCDGVLRHYALRYRASDSQLALFVDGALIGTSNGQPSSDVTVFHRPLTVGGSTTSQAFDGTAAHVALYPTALTDQAVAGLAQSGQTGFVGEPSDARIARYAAYGGIAATDMALEPGALARVPLQPLAGVSPDAAISEVVTAEGGAVFTRGDGVFVLQNRYHRSVQTTPDMSLIGHDLGGDTAIQYDMDKVSNYATGQRQDGPQLISQNAASITAHGQYPTDLGTLLVTTDAQVQDACDWRVANYAEPTPRLPGVVIDIATQPLAFQQAILGLELSDRLAFSALPTQAPAVGDQLIEGWVETVQLSEDSSEWSIALNTSAWAVEQAWVLGNATYGRLGTTSRLGY